MNRDEWVFVAVLLCVTAIAFYMLGMRDGASLGVQCPEANAGERLTSSDQTSCQYVQHMSYGQAMRTRDAAWDAAWAAATAPKEMK